MSEHRRKPPQTPGGGRAAARRGAQQQPPPSGGRRGAQPYDSEPESQYAGRADSRPGGGRRRGAENASGPVVVGRNGRRGGSAGPPPKRLLDYPRWGKEGWRRWMPSWKQVTGLTIAFFGSLVAVAGIGYATVGVPNVDAAATAQNNVYYWANGKRMVATGGEVNRQIVGYPQIPAAMRYAVISAENKTFETDGGVDPMGIARALFNMAKGGQTQGGSTITQQYVKNSRLDQSQTISRKFKELFISIKVDQKMSKEDIIRDYLNTAYYGRGAYGIQAAAQTYYGVNSEDLNPSQCALLAALLKGATYYDPAGAADIDPAATAEANTARSKYRWGWILDEEVKDGHLTAAERAKYTEYPLPQAPRKNKGEAGQIGYLVSLAKSYVINNNTELGITAEELAKGGYQIHTTFDQAKVNELEKAVAAVTEANIKPEEREVDKYVQFGGASVDPADGAILAIYGGPDATTHFTNNADETGAQVGSTFKPFVLAAAMTYGVRNPADASERTKVSPTSVFDGANDLLIRNYDGTVWKNEKNQEWKQENDGQQSYGPITLREAMRESVNSPYVQLGMDVGTDKVKDTAVAAGLREGSLASSNNSPAFSLGTSSPSAIRMAGAYATFAAHGEQNDPYSVTKVEKDGETVYTHKADPKEAIDKAVADNVTDVLKTVVEEGTGTNAQLPDGRPVAGKTGTTDGNKSAWFVGYTPQLSTSIGMFRLNPDAKTKTFLKMFGVGGQEKIHGASFPSEIWADYMSEALDGEEIEEFDVPDAIGETVYGGGASSPTPSPTVTTAPTTTPPASPTETETETASASPSPSDSETCDPLDVSCRGNGNTADPSTSTATPSESVTTTTEPPGNENGGSTGLIGGPDGG